MRNYHAAYRIIERELMADTCIVIDTNEWIRLKWLGTSIGSTFIATLKRTPSAVLAIPEVLERELDKHRAEASRTLLAKLTDVIADIGTVTGNRTAGGIVTLTEEDIDVAIRGRQASLSAQTIYPPMQLDEVRRALDRVNAETPPNGYKNQQMKDSLLWESCVSLTDQYRVLLVTGDKGFYADRQKGTLAANLAEEPAVMGGLLLVFPALEDAMRVLAPDSLVTLDADEFARIDIEELIAVRAEEAVELSSVAAIRDSQFQLYGVSPSYFRTEIPYEFVVSFTVFFHVNRGIDGGKQGEVAVRGECRLDTRSGTIDAVALEGIYWRLTSAVGGWIEDSELFNNMIT
jgi:hypothetical protein